MFFNRTMEKAKKARADAQAQANAQPTVRTNNFWDNVDCSPLAPTDTLNVKVSPALVTALTGATITTAANPGIGFLAFGTAIASPMVGDLVRGDPSISVSITGHHGETFGHLDFPHH